MSTFVFVHGAWHGTWCWKRVRRLLQEGGHEVFTPALTGLADRSHLLTPEVDLHNHIADVVNQLRWEELADVVLCRHSYGGCVISGVAEQVTDRLRALVYIDALLLKDGESVFDLIPREHREAQLAAAESYGEGWKLPPLPAEAFGTNPNDVAWVNRQCTMQPLASFQQRLRLSVS